MEWQERLNRALDYIEANLGEDLSWEAVAREANTSPFHFLRMFEVVVGQTPGDYLRRRRLSRAAQELASGEGKIIDIGLRAGYDSPDAFARAFKRLFGMNPSEARQAGASLVAYGPLRVAVVLKGMVSMEYRIEELSGFTLVGLGFRTTGVDGQSMREIPPFWDRLREDGSSAMLEAAIRPDSRFGYCGVCAEFDEKCEAFTYLAAIEGPVDRERLPEGARDLQVPAATWAVFPCRGPMPGAIQDCWKRIWAEWFPDSGWEAAPGPQLEVYSKGDMASADYYSEVWIPIRKARRP